MHASFSFARPVGIPRDPAPEKATLRLERPKGWGQASVPTDISAELLATDKPT